MAVLADAVHLRVAPRFAAFADELAAAWAARGARPDETCVTGYVTAAGETVTTPGDRCVAHCEMAYTVGVTPQPRDLEPSKLDGVARLAQARAAVRDTRARGPRCGR